MNRQKGFTLIELMIATAVFGAILILCMGAFIQIGKMYYKGVTVAKTQEATRSVMDEITRSIQFSKDPIKKGAANGYGNSYCVGLARYSFVLDKKLVDAAPVTPTNESKHVLWRDSQQRTSCEATQPIDVDFVSDSPGNAGKLTELLSDGMRINELKLTPLEPGKDFNPSSDGISDSQVWEVIVSIAYGDDDLLDKSGTDVICKGGAEVVGSQFCAVSKLRSVVTRRLQ